MADLPQQNTIIQYYGDGVETDYVVPFFTPTESDGTADLDAYITPDGQEPIPEADIKVYGVDYTYAANPDPITGGIITWLAGSIPAFGDIVTFSRNIQAALNVEFSNAQNFSGANLDAALDKLLLITQQNKTYALQRNLSYKVNALQPDTNIEANTQLPQLLENQIWKGQGGGVIASTLEENPDVSTLRSDLANESPSSNGASIVGYYNPVTATPETVKDALDGIFNFASLVPAGVMMDFGGTSAPQGWLVCDGTAVSRTTYSRLFAAIGTVWGAGDGSTTFNLPDYRRRVSVGSGGAGTGVLGNAVGNVGGAETHTLTNAEIPAHSHPLSSFASALVTDTQGGSGGVAIRVVQYTAPPVNEFLINGITGNDGGNGAHSIVQSSAVALRIIKW